MRIIQETKSGKINQMKKMTARLLKMKIKTQEIKKKLKKRRKEKLKPIK